MPLKVLIVDDSAFFRRRIKEILERRSELQIVGGADNGHTAVEMAERLAPDIITMDYEMPVMDGITAVREIMARRPTPILMFSSLSYEGARVTLDALEAGAVDYLPKSFESMANSAEESARILQDRVIAVGRSRSGVKPSVAPVSKPGRSVRRSPEPSRQAISQATTPVRPVKTGATTIDQAIDAVKRHRPRVLAVGASTGGPVALQNLLANLPANFPLPILLTQHMPGTFTEAFAQRLNRVCQIQVKEAENHDALRPGVALLAPGGKQLLISDNAQNVAVVDGSERFQYKPSVDVTFGSVARAFHGKALGIVLTGMGADGREGCKLLKREGAYVWTQDEASCVVYGMPMAVAQAGYSDLVLPIDAFADNLKRALL